MTQQEIDQTLAKFADALRQDDEAAGQAAVIALAGVIIGSITRIADALDHLARNLPAPK